MVTSPEGSWLVGGPTRPSDPPDAGNAQMPAVFMPANPKVGDSFKPEDLFPIVDETVTVKKIGVEVRLPAGRFDNAIQVRETSRLPDSQPKTKRYAARGGVVTGKPTGESCGLPESTSRTGRA